MMNKDGCIKQSSFVCIKIDFCDADTITIQENIFY